MSMAFEPWLTFSVFVLVLLGLQNIGCVTLVNGLDINVIVFRHSLNHNLIDLVVQDEDFNVLGLVGFQER